MDKQQTTLAHARQDSSIQRLFIGLEETNALHVAWDVLSHTHPRYASKFDHDLIDDVFAQDILGVIQEYTCEFVTYADVLSIEQNLVTLSARITTELPLKVQGKYLKLPPCPLIADAPSLVLRASGPTVVAGSVLVSNQKKTEDSLAAKVCFKVVAAPSHLIELDFLTINRFFDRHTVRVDSNEK